jgi:hypothetical protein
MAAIYVTRIRGRLCFNSKEQTTHTHIGYTRRMQKSLAKIYYEYEGEFHKAFSHYKINMNYRNIL